MRVTRLGHFASGKALLDRMRQFNEDGLHIERQTDARVVSAAYREAGHRLGNSYRCVSELLFAALDELVDLHVPQAEIDRAILFIADWSLGEALRRVEARAWLRDTAGEQPIH